MKPTLENVRKLAEREPTVDGLLQLEDYCAFFIAGAKEAAQSLGHSVNDVELTVLDKGRRVQEFIRDQIQKRVK